MQVITKDWNAWYSTAQNLLLVTGKVHTPAGHPAFLEKRKEGRMKELWLELVLLNGIDAILNPQLVTYREVVPQGARHRTVRIFYQQREIVAIREIWVV